MGGIVKAEESYLLKITAINTALAIIFSIISVLHTITVVSSKGFFEANPIASLVLKTSPTLALLIPILLCLIFVQLSWDYNEYCAVAVSSVFLGVYFFDAMTHIFLIMNGG